MNERLDSICLRRLFCLAALAGLMSVTSVYAQDLEPRRWSHLPVGMHSLTIGYAGQDAEIYFNPILGITDGTANVNAWLGRYSYSFDWAGKTARIDAILPYVSGTWQGLVFGEPGSRTIRAGGDPWLRLSVNFAGAPAMRPRELAGYIAENPVRTVFGASIAVSPPLGAYDPTELINIGRNAYVVRPQLGALHIRGPWSLELTGSVFLFGNNDNYVESLTVSQKPVYAVQTHLTRTFDNGLWLGTGLAYAVGGRTSIEGAETNYRVDNLLWNVVAGFRLTPRQNIVISWQRDRTQNASGSDADNWIVSWLFSWPN